jgi:hypothetical protein
MDLADALSPANYHALIRTLLGGQVALFSVSIAVYHFAIPRLAEAMDRQRNALRVFAEAVNEYKKTRAESARFLADQLQQLLPEQGEKLTQGQSLSRFRWIPLWPIVILVECLVYTWRWIPDHWLLTLTALVFAAYSLYLVLASRNVLAELRWARSMLRNAEDTLLAVRVILQSVSSRPADEDERGKDR